MTLTLYAEFQNEARQGLTIAVIGLGYIGLPTAAALAEVGHKVIGVDIDPRVIESVSEGRSHIVEPGLDALLKMVSDNGALAAVDKPPVADAYLITVPTPAAADEAHTPDLSFVFAAADAIAPQLRPGALIVLESTSRVGTTRAMIKHLAEVRPDLKFPEPGRSEDETDVDVVYSPERVIPGRTLSELRTNARVVGGTSQRAARRAAQIYRSLTSGELLLTDDRTAEFVKLTENAFRDVNIAFANELSLISEEIGVDVWEVIELANRHPRVNILQPGPGVGGHCIAVDPWFIVAQAPEAARLIRTAREINDSKPDFVIGKVAAFMDEDPNLRLACLGLTFKADVDDFRESPSLAIATALAERYPARVVCAEPFAEAMSPDHGLTLVDLEEALACDVVLGLVPHTQYRRMPRPQGRVIDTCGIWR